MLRYYFFLGIRSLRRNPALTALIVLTLAIGVAASVSTLTILHIMSGDPIPKKSDRLIAPILDNGPLEGYTPGAKPFDHQMSYQDVQNLLASKQGIRRAGLYRVNGVIEPPRKDIGVIDVTGLATNKDFFEMLEIPMLYGQPWRDEDEKASADLIVLSRKTSEKVFGNVNPVGQHIRMFNSDFKVSGVFDTWAPRPKFYSYNGRSEAFTSEEEFIIPLSSAIRHELPHEGNMSCHSSRDAGWQGILKSECTWLHFWFELKSAGDRPALQNYIDNYVADQHKLGRYQRQAPNHLYNVREWLVEMKVIGDDSKLSAWLAFGFLLLCMVNTIGLLLAKFSVRASEVGVRRALGASRAEIFLQFLVETAVVGLAGAVVGIVLAFGALALIALQSKHLAAVAHMDWLMLGVTLLLSVSAAVLAGLLPTWRACQVTPAIQLKSQ